MTAQNIKVGIIGGTGFNDFLEVERIQEQDVTTPFGKPSDILTEGFISGIPCVILPRHGKSHSISPTNINFRANIWALKHLGCTHILAVNACGSLQDDIKPGDFVVIDQFFDRTNQRIQTFYDGKPESLKGVFHVPMNEPFCETTRQVLIDASVKTLDHVHKKGTIVVIEGGRYSSKFESKYYHQIGISVIGMTTIPEVILAKELGLCYATLAMVTDYDSWKDDVPSVDSQSVMNIIKKISVSAKHIILEAIKIIGEKDWKEVIDKNMDMVTASKI